MIQVKDNVVPEKYSYLFEKVLGADLAYYRAPSTYGRIIYLGHTLLKDNPLSLHLVFSHFHYDHVWGWPFFEPALDNKGAISDPMAPKPINPIFCI